MLSRPLVDSSNIGPKPLPLHFYFRRGAWAKRKTLSLLIMLMCKFPMIRLLIIRCYKSGAKLYDWQLSSSREWVDRILIRHNSFLGANAQTTEDFGSEGANTPIQQIFGYLINAILNFLCSVSVMQRFFFTLAGLHEVCWFYLWQYALNTRWIGYHWKLASQLPLEYLHLLKPLLYSTPFQRNKNY